MKTSAKKIILPCIEITKVSTAKTPEAVAVILPPLLDDAAQVYFISPRHKGRTGMRRDGLPVWEKQRYNHFPVVLDSTGAPWAEAMVYLLAKLEGATDPSMSTYHSLASGLAAFRMFLDETGIDWLKFPAFKLARPTYRFNGYLTKLVRGKEIAGNTARRQMGTVIGFYRWLVKEKVFVPENPLWVESDRYIKFEDSHGRTGTKPVVTTDVTIHVPKNEDPYGGYIDDGGKLRPLPYKEQEWLIDALMHRGNTEMSLIHLLGMLTGGRIQSILTFKVSHTKQPLSNAVFGEIRVPIGLGTDIDTKKNKKMTLYIPVWLYEKLQIYSNSDRAKKRRAKAKGGDTDDQYLFLSVRGAPLYEDKDDALEYDEEANTRYTRKGQGVRQFITERVLPYIRKKFGPEAKDFKYRFHDTRATAGMNWTDHQLSLVEQGKTTLSEAREFVKTRMGHKSANTTDLYLQYRKNLALVRSLGQEYDCHLKRIAGPLLKWL